jgi:Protein of unknown function (DUF2950)
MAELDRADSPIVQATRAVLLLGQTSKGHKAAAVWHRAPTCNGRRVAEHLVASTKASAHRILDNAARRVGNSAAGAAAASSAAEAAVAAAEEVSMDGASKSDGMLHRLTIACATVLGILAIIAAGPVTPAASSEFNTPEEAVAALVQAAQSNDRQSLAAVLGPGSEALVSSGDPTKDASETRKFLDDYKAKHSLAPDGPQRVVLTIGDNDWPMPIPLVEQNGKWHFDSRQGAQQIVDRRIGRNEIEAIRTCLAYVDAQQDYFDLFKQVKGTGAYAQRLVSTPGNYDGLYWPDAPGIPASPFSALVSKAIEEEGYPGDLVSGKQAPYEGYYFRILTAQGPNATGGARNYIADGGMTGGFALIAWPASYGASGIMTFLVDQDGIVFQKDLGADTAKRAAAIKQFDPDLSWARIDITQH